MSAVIICKWTLSHYDDDDDDCLPSASPIYPFSAPWHRTFIHLAYMYGTLQLYKTPL